MSNWPPPPEQLVAEYEAATSPRRRFIAKKYGVTEWAVRCAVQKAFHAMHITSVPRFYPAGPKAVDFIGKGIKQRISDVEFNERCRKYRDTWNPTMSSMAWF